MRFSLAVAIALVGMSLSGWAQQNNTFKVKHAATKTPKSAPIGKTTPGPTASNSASKDLEKLERQSAKPAGVARPAGRAPALKAAKDKPNPPINFSGTGGSRRPGTTNQSSNPYKGRLRQKNGH
ncbi:MAG: hypothetical protein LAO23_08185 [Acidobacteriia bacterium]|nr:hypothetical protein [Terriglobia bacterium]